MKIIYKLWNFLAISVECLFWLLAGVVVVIAGILGGLAAMVDSARVEVE